MTSLLVEDIQDPTIIFECSDVKKDTGLLLLKRKKDDIFEIYLHNDYTNKVIAMVLDIRDFAKMFDALEEYFQRTDNRDMNSKNKNLP